MKLSVPFKSIFIPESSIPAARVLVLPGISPSILWSRFLASSHFQLSLTLPQALSVALIIN